VLVYKRVVFTAASTIFLLAGALMPAPARAAVKDLDGYGGVGGTFGWMAYLSGFELSRSNPRPIFHFRASYFLTSQIDLEGEVGFGWNAYEPRADGMQDVVVENPDGSRDWYEITAPTVAVVSPWTVGASYRKDVGAGNLIPHVGAGAGAYIMDIRTDYRTTIKDPITGEKMRWVSPGFYMKVGTEVVWNSGAALSFDLLYNILLSENEDFVNGWATNTSFLELRVGGTYYFNLGGGSGAVPETGEEN